MANLIMYNNYTGINSGQFTKLRNKKAFTLAEVLVTLGIIGIVAAMTLPSVLADYKKKEIPVRLLKFSSTLQNAFNLATIDYGPSTNWAYPSQQNNAEQTNAFVNTYIFPYLTGLRSCDANEQKCKRIAKSLYGSTNDRMPVYIFSDGSCFGMITGGSTEISAQLHFTYDYNCLGKPNEYDKDIFTFYLRQQAGEAPKMYAGNFPVLNAHSREDFLELCKNHAESKHYQGICSALIEYDGWEIRDDYPWL